MLLIEYRLAPRRAASTAPASRAAVRACSMAAASALALLSHPITSAMTARLSTTSVVAVAHSLAPRDQVDNLSSFMCASEGPRYR
jgi:hypothetical protein